MKLLIFGDVHCEWDDLNATIAKAVRRHRDATALIQVGDLGYSWPGIKPFKLSKAYYSDCPDLYEKAIKLPFYWLEGNHECFSQLEKDQGASQPGMIYQPRGSVIDFGEPVGRAMFFGGASSIDKDRRTPGVSWWPEESITYGQVRKTIETVDSPVDVMFTHEHPLTFPYSDSRYDNKLFGISDKQALDAIREHFKPKWHFFGHHHDFGSGETLGTKWFCCPIIEDRSYISFNGEEAMLWRE